MFRVGNSHQRSLANKVFKTTVKSLYISCVQSKILEPHTVFFRWRISIRQSLIFRMCIPHCYEIAKTPISRELRYPPFLVLFSNAPFLNRTFPKLHLRCNWAYLFFLRYPYYRNNIEKTTNIDQFAESQLLWKIQG